MTAENRARDMDEFRLFSGTAGWAAAWFGIDWLYGADEGAEEFAIDLRSESVYVEALA
jgi:hypothetical protein